MNSQLILALLVVSVFSSCNQNKNQLVRIGDFDSSAIANDTLMQKGLESSYEYHKSLAVNKNLVYDVVGYGGSASEGEFAILKRGADNKADTLVKEERDGIIVTSFIADLNGNKNEEVYLITQSVGSGAYGNVLGFEFGNNKGLPIKFDTGKKPLNGYMGHDSIYFDKNFIVRQFPVYKDKDPNCCPTNGIARIYYEMKNFELIEKTTEIFKPQTGNKP